MSPLVLGLLVNLPLIVATAVTCVVWRTIQRRLHFFRGGDLVAFRIAECNSAGLHRRLFAERWGTYPRGGQRIFHTKRTCRIDSDFHNRDPLSLVASWSFS